MQGHKRISKLNAKRKLETLIRGLEKSVGKEYVVTTYDNSGNEVRKLHPAVDPLQKALAKYLDHFEPKVKDEVSQQRMGDWLEFHRPVRPEKLSSAGRLFSLPSCVA